MKGGGKVGKESDKCKGITEVDNSSNEKEGRKTERRKKKNKVRRGWERWKAEEGIPE